MSVGVFSSFNGYSTLGYVIIQYKNPRVLLCGNLNSYARATPLSRGLQETPCGGLKCSQQLSSHIHTPTVCLNICVLAHFMGIVP